MKKIKIALWSLLFSSIAFLFVIIFAYFYWVGPYIPDTNKIKEISLSTPMKIVTNDNYLISEVGVQRRYLINYEDIPQNLINALLVTEDLRFFEHSGIDFKGLVRATLSLIRTGEKKQGASTITMQLARNFFLTRERSFLRKFRELFLARRLESVFTKQEILTLYINRIFLGNRSYGFQAAAQTYFGKKLEQLNLSEIALLTGLPKAPSTFNPIANPKRAKIRRNYILKRLLDNQLINQKQYDEAIIEPVFSKLFNVEVEVPAGHIAEMVRQKASELLDDDNNIYDKGYVVVTTINRKKQLAANNAVQQGLLKYIRRHNWTGVEKTVFIDQQKPINQLSNKYIEATQQIKNIDGLIRAIIIQSDGDLVEVMTEEKEIVLLSDKDIKWTKSTWQDIHSKSFDSKTAYQQLQKDIQYNLDRENSNIYFYPSIDILRKKNKPHNKPLPLGGLIYLRKKADNSYFLVTAPRTQAALVSINPQNGAVLSLVGGFNYYNYKFNRATQARRQPGSNFKPFLYAASLEKGYTAATIINDSPVSFEDESTGFIWTPNNYSGKYFGDTRFREALVKSRNLVSVRLLNSIGVNYAINYMKKFGFPQNTFLQNRNLSIALGSAPLTPLEIARGYATFANGGYLIDPYIIDRIEDREGNIIYQKKVQSVCYQNCDNLLDESQHNTTATLSTVAQTLDGDVSYIISDILRDVIRAGTGRKARQLKRSDIGGKTGTTNDLYDAWFSGYNPHIVTTVWTGYDQPQSMGEKETGASAALPIWIDYMRTALKDTPKYILPKSSNIVQVRINKKDGKVSLNNNNPRATLLESFRIPNAPTINQSEQSDNNNNNQNNNLIEKLF